MPKKTRPRVVETLFRRVSSAAKAVTGEAVTIPAGIAGTYKDFNLVKAPITNVAGNDIASNNDTSLVLTSTAFDNEVMPCEDSELVNGDFWVDYLTGKSRGKKKDTSTSATASYSIFALTIDATLETGDIEIGAVELKNASTDERAEIVSADAGNVSSTKVLKVQPVDEVGSVITSDGAPAGGGVYSTEQGDFTATITNATNNIVLSTDSLGGTTLTAAHFANGILKVIKTSDNSVVTIAMDDIDWTSATKTLDTSGCTNAFTFATGDIVSLTLLSSRIQDNRGADAKKGIEQAPIYTHNIGDTLAEVTNETNATNNYYLDVTGYDQAYFDFEGVAGTDTITLTLEASAQDDGTVDSSCSYTDISQYGISPTTQAAGAASYTADLSAVIDCKGMKFIKFKTVSSGGADDGDYNLRARRAY